jgi:membrane-bound lytic murein transglycosylase D
MPDDTIFRLKTPWRVRLAVIAIWIIPASLWSQMSSSLQPVPMATDQPFAGYDDSLSRAADALLVSASLRPLGDKEKVIVDETASAGRAIHNDRQPQIWTGRLSIAAAHPDVRLEMLHPVVDPILLRHGVPTDLAAVILVESGARADALSPKGARGLWQLMPATARRYGLRVDDIDDDRLDLFKATEAAANYLHDLYAQFGDWRLALAAYNTGEANVGSAILRAHTQDFDQLSSLGLLPIETRNYVPRVFAAIRSSGQSSSLAEYRRIESAMTVFAVTSRW